MPKLGDGWGYRYEKFHRTAQAWAIVGVAAVARRSNGHVAEARIGLTNMGSVPVRATRGGGRGRRARRRPARRCAPRPRTPRRHRAASDLHGARTTAGTWPGS